MDTTETTYTVPAGTAVRTVDGYNAVLRHDWYDWECTVDVERSDGARLTYHPRKVYRDGMSLPYEG